MIALREWTPDASVLLAFLYIYWFASFEPYIEFMQILYSLAKMCTKQKQDFGFLCIGSNAIRM